MNYKKLIQEELNKVSESKFAKKTDKQLAYYDSKIGTRLPDYAIEKIKNTLKVTLDNLSIEERKKMFANNSMLGKTHSEETKKKMSEKAIGKIISENQRKLASEKNSIPIIATNLITGKKTEYNSCKEASTTLGLTGILHVLKGRSKQCGGYYFEYKQK